jgi:hypothetical protein
MARGFHDVIYLGGAQTLVHVPPGVVASATVEIADLTQDEDGDDRFILASGAATVDTYSTTIAADAGAGEADPRLLTHAGSSATAGRTYAITASDGSYETFVAEAVSSTTIRASVPLSAYASGSTVSGIQLSCSFPAISANDEDLFDGNPPLRVRWTYTFREQLYQEDEIVRLVRHKPRLAGLGAVEAALRSSWWELVKQIPRTPNALRDLVSSVADRLQTKLRARGIEPESFMLGAPGVELLQQACVLRLADQGCHPENRDPQAFRDEQEAEFARLWAWLTQGRSAEGAADVDRVTDTAPTGSSKRYRSVFLRG